MGSPRVTYSKTIRGFIWILGLRVGRACGIWNYRTVVRVGLGVFLDITMQHVASVLAFQFSSCGLLIANMAAALALALGAWRMRTQRTAHSFFAFSVSVCVCVCGFGFGLCLCFWILLLLFELEFIWTARSPAWGSYGEWTSGWTDCSCGLRLLLATCHCPCPRPCDCVRVRVCVQHGELGTAHSGGGRGQRAHS